MLYYFSRLFSGLVLWVCIGVLAVTGGTVLYMGVVEFIKPDPWYVQAWQTTVDFITGLVG